MRKNYFLSAIFILLAIAAFAQPANNNCNTAQSLGTLPTPAPCPSGIGTTVSTTGTNVGATAPNPYVYLLGCQPSGNQAAPALDVWYSFTATGNQLVINMTGSLASPNVALWTGNCNNLTGFGCAIGATNGNLSVTFQPTTPGVTYYLQVSGNSAVSTGTFTLTVNNNNDCTDCLQTSSLSVSPTPNNGTYPPNTTVTFCYTITSWTQVSANWLHGVIPTFGCGWDLTTLAGTTHPPGGNGYSWVWGNGPLGPGWWVDYDPVGPTGPNGIFTDNYGDPTITGTGSWTFCFSVKTKPNCACNNLSVSINTTSDGETGNWTSPACTDDAVYQFSALLNCCSVTATGTNVPCFGSSSGSATATQTSGTGPYTYLWSPTGGTAATATNLPAGTYTITSTDNTGCVSTATVNITQPPQITTTPTQTNVACFGGATGSASVTATGGNGTYTYSWAPTGGTGASATGLTAGSYTVTVSSPAGCTATQTFNITQPPAITLTPTQTNVACFGGATGSASVTATGGNGTYTYSWAPTGGTGASATGLTAGSYTVTVSSPAGCTATQTFNITQPPALTASTTFTQATCGNANGSASVLATGGSPSYSYLWAPSGGSGAIATGLIGGNYTVTVTDAHGCTTTASVTIPNASTLTTSITASTNVSCFGGNSGSATVTPSGGSSPYTYTWSPTGGNGPTGGSLSNGSYTVTVTDALGCTSSSTVLITQAPAITLTPTQSNVTCFGSATGSASVSASGGNGTYTYSWAPAGGTGATATGLTAGSYTVTVSSPAGCTSSQTYTITQPSAISTTTSFTQSTCGNSNGSASVAVTGGSPTYTYSWAPSGGNTSIATGLAGGNYTVTITDANGCTSTASVNIPNTSTLTSTISSSTDVSCFGGSDGAATVLANGGNSPYTYAWSPSGGTGTTATTLTAGTYVVIVTDASGCTATSSVAILEPALLTATTTSSSILCFGAPTGAISTNVVGGTGAYSYAWVPSGGIGSSASGLSAGTYTVTVTDVNGCTTTATATITEPAQLTTSIASTPALCFGSNNGTASVSGTGGTGSYSYSWAPSGGSGSVALNLSSGNYTVTVTDANGCTASSSVSITEPTAITTTTSGVDANCNLTNGSVSATAVGGTGTLSYQWTNPGGPSSANWNNIGSGTYTVIVTDVNGCSDTVSQVVNNINGVSTSLTTATNVSCFNSSDGFIDIDATGGNPGYTYNWTPNVSTTDVASGVPAGSYVVNVVDLSGCTSSLTINITQPALLTVAATSTPSAVCVGTPIQLNATPAGGTAGYTLLWNPGNMAGPSQTVTPLTSTNYTVDLTDANGCTASTTVNVLVNEIPIAILTADVNAGCAPLCVNFTDQSTIAAGSITGWQWDFGDNTTSSLQNPPLHCYNTPGVYSITLTVTAVGGCSQTITMSNYIDVYAVPVAAFIAGPQPTTMADPVIVFTDQSTFADSWQWSFGDLLNSSSNLQNPSFTYSDPDCYQVVLEVTSIDGCVDTTQQEICIGPDVTLYVPNTFSPDGDGNNEIFIPVTQGIDPEKYELWIFDRWGNLIFYTDNMSNGWDGRASGHSEICQIDTYVWKIKAKDILGIQHNLIGHVNLIR